MNAFHSNYIFMHRTGGSIYLTWIDQQNTIESQAIDLVDDLPYFLLLLLVLQRFNNAKWGYFMECPQSHLKMVPVAKPPTASFTGHDTTNQETEVFFHPYNDVVYPGRGLVGHGTNIIGGRAEQQPDVTELNLDELQTGNDLAVKIYWPEEDRMSEVEILKEARECGKEISFISNHIPKLVCHRDPNFLCSSTKTIRQFLGLATSGSRCLRVIVFQRLQPIKGLKEKEMLTAYLQCFFCECDE